MIYLLLTILLNVFLSVVFKWFDRYRIDSLQAIVVNYWVCALTGSALIGQYPVNAASASQPWLPWALVMGIGFFSVFNLIAYSTRKDGITTTTVANKLSMVIPACLAIWLYADKINIGKGAGILLAIPAVYLSTRTGDEAAAKKPRFILPMLLFLGSGLLDTLVSYIARQYFDTGNAALDNAGQVSYLIHTFSIAGAAGTLLVITLLLLGNRIFAWKNILAGCLLGVPNYFSIHYFFRLLQSGFLQSSAAIPVNNIGIVLLSAIVAILFFKEKAVPARILGLALSITAILLIAFFDDSNP